MKRLQKIIGLLVCVFTIYWGLGMTVYAAEGKLMIAVSESQVSVGDRITVTIWATGPEGEKAKSDMEFTYNESVFSFVKCNAQDYSGGEGGKVVVRGNSIQVTLEAIAEGESGLKVTGSNGSLTEDGEALSAMVPAGTVIRANSGSAQQTPETDNTETDSPETDNTETDSMETDNSETENSETNNSETDNGETENSETTNSVSNEDEIQHNESEPEILDENYGEIVEEGGLSAEEKEDYEMQIRGLQLENEKLEKSYKDARSSGRKTTAVLVFIIVVLVIVIVNLVMYMSQMAEERSRRRKKTRSSNSAPQKKKMSTQTTEPLRQKNIKQKSEIDVIDLDKL